MFPSVNLESIRKLIHDAINNLLYYQGSGRRTCPGQSPPHIIGAFSVWDLHRQIGFVVMSMQVPARCSDRISLAICDRPGDIFALIEDKRSIYQSEAVVVDLRECRKRIGSSAGRNECTFDRLPYHITAYLVYNWNILFFEHSHCHQLSGWEVEVLKRLRHLLDRELRNC